MHVLMVTDAYPPMRTSCAVQMHDLAQAFLGEGHQATIVTPNSQLKASLSIDWQEGVQVIQVKALASKDVNYVRRTFAEFINPFLIWHQLKRNPTFLNTAFDGVIWYSPTIFWGPLIKRIKGQFKIRSYLILRDIFPDWAVDLGLIKKGLVYQFLKSVEHFQYHQADVIGIQSPNNLQYFQRHHPQEGAKAQVLWNWIGKHQEMPCSIDLSKTPLAGRVIFAYTGNMGVAQGMERLIAIAQEFKGDSRYGFIFVGRGSEVSHLKDLARQKNLDNILFFDEINPSQVPGLLKQCAIGLIALDQRHQSHNIPGKFLSYLQSGLPVLALINPGNDLEKIILDFRVGQVNTSFCESEIVTQARMLLKDLEDPQMNIRCLDLANQFFAPQNATKAIVRSFSYLS